MKLLLSSIACSPYGGSETFYGWRSTRTLAEHHEVWVLVQGGTRPQLERAIKEGLVPDTMHFLYVGETNKYHENRLIARVQSWLDYIKFNRQLLSVAREAHEKIGFDLAHHLTYTTWRVGCPLWELGIPLIWGPISGTEQFPLSSFAGILSPSAKFFELSRILAGIGSKLSSSVRNCAQNSFHIFAAHSQSLGQLVELRGKKEGVSVLCNLYFSSGEVSKNLDRVFDPASKAPLKLFASGNLEGRKGVALALHALAIAKKEGVAFRYRISSKGPELAHLQKLAKELDLDEEVVFANPFSREDYFAELKSSDIYLLPSLREGAGQTMMEAMLRGCVPIVAALGGPQEIVTDECGFRIPAKDPEQVARDIAHVIKDLYGNRNKLATMGRAAQLHIANAYSEENFVKQMNEVYERAMAKRPAAAA